MKANELRIGNIYKDDRKGARGYRFVTSRVIADLASNPNIDLYHPIPLTKEWLVKFGFEKLKAYDFGISLNKVPRFERNGISIMLSGGKFWYATRQYDGGTSDPYEPVLEVQYVHQLQNLYFALTGEELPIKES